MSDRVIVFDDRLGQLAPLTDLRPSFLVRTGALTTLGRLCRDPRWRVEGVMAPHAWLALTRELLVREREHDGALPADLPVYSADAPGADQPPIAEALYLNGACVLPHGEATALPSGHALVEDARVVAWRGSGGDAPAILRGERAGAGSSPVAGGRTLLARPWHVRSSRDAAIAHDLALLKRDTSVLDVPDGVTVLGDRASLRAHASARVAPGTIFDVEQGMIVLDAHAVVRPGAILIGPCFVGAHATVLERATIRPNTVIGPWCKVNGEVGGAIFQGYANKAHDGYLGDSWVGEWVNLGAGTANSNLLNTYGELVARATPGGKHERTGEHFLGAIIGDHVKTAICTRLMTACVLHTGGMFATTAPVSGTVGAFTWATDDAETGRATHRAYRIEKFLEVMSAAMARRKIAPSQAYIARLRECADAAARPSASDGR
jgi:UDP-N-acetylglucosamine diphosphorylase/glucosamine-1-phosphate N-acetyltransferase